MITIYDVIAFFQSKKMASTIKSKGQGAKTRHKSGSHFKDFMGGVKKFLPEEAPTLRDVIQKGL